MIHRVAAVLQDRAHSFGEQAPDVRIKDAQRIVVSGAQDRATLVRVMAPVGRLEIRYLSDVTGSSKRPGTIRLEMRHGTGGEPDYVVFFRGDSSKSVPVAAVLKAAPVVLTEDDLKRTVTAGTDAFGSPTLNVELTKAGTDRFATFTSSHVGAVLAVLVDGRIISTPKVNSPVTSGRLSLYGGFATLSAARDLARVLNSGPLPIALRVVPGRG